MSAMPRIWNKVTKTYVQLNEKLKKKVKHILDKVQACVNATHPSSSSLN